MSLAELRRLVAPPEHPIGTGAPGQWEEVERHLGTQLPTDYKEFISEYGAGGFYDFLGIKSPFSKRSNLIEWTQFMQTLEQKRHPIFPQPGGLLSFGGDENGNELFWKTLGPADSWPVVYASADWLDYEEFATTVTGFLVGWLAGSIRPKLIEHMRVLERSAPPFEPNRFE